MGKKKLKLKQNYLLEKIPEIFTDLKRGTVLDLGCGQGRYAIELDKLGFDVTAADCEERSFDSSSNIKFQKCILSERLPFEDNTFDYLLFLEVIEHLQNPFEVIEELTRVLKPGGELILSTPNILNLGSRMRFLMEGAFDFFREPVLDYHKIYIGSAENLHIVVWRYHELEYMLYIKGLAVEGIYTDYIKNNLKILYYLLWPILKWHNAAKKRKTVKDGGIDYTRIQKILFSKELMFGKHLILRAKKMNAKPKIITQKGEAKFI